MRIRSAHIEGFRAIAKLDVDFDSLTAFVGTGGVGKSTVLNALDWFFAGGNRAERDLHMAAEGEDRAESILVAVTFDDLTPADRDALGRYAPLGADSTTLTRTWDPDSGEKLSGNALVHPPFDEIREMEGGAREKRAAYVTLRNSEGALDYPEPARGWDDTLAVMEQWERENSGETELRATDARHLGGFTGNSKLARRFTYVLVGATAGAPDTLEGRGSPLERLLSVVEELTEEKRREIDDLQDDAHEKVKEVLKNARGGDLLSLSSKLSDRVGGYFPGAAIKLSDNVEPPRPPQISVRALVSDRGGQPLEPELQGHGLQRAIVIALLHELAQAGGPVGGEGAPADPPGLMLAIEEPELYQHPLQARSLAATLEALSEGERNIQVAYTTHSPYFTSPALFQDIRLCRRGGDGTSAKAADPTAIETAITEAGYGGDIANKIRGALTRTLREAIFARGVLLTEGPTDTAILQGIADNQGGLDADGVALADCVNKDSLGIAIAILRELEIPFFAFFDADRVGNNPDEATRNKRILRVCGEPEVEWPDAEVRECSGNFEDKLETDLATIWPQFEEARGRAAAELKVRNEKDPRVYREAARKAGEPPQLLVDVLSRARDLAA